MRKPKSPQLSIRDVADTQSGPLAEAQALVDVLEFVAVENITLRDNSFATLSHMLSDRLKQVRAVVDLEVARG